MSDKETPHCKCDNPDHWKSLDLGWFGKMIKCTVCKSQFFVRTAS